MADGLAGMLAGTDPTAPLQLRAAQQEQLYNTAIGTDWAGGGMLGALARTIGSTAGGRAEDTVRQVTEARQAALPDLAAAYAAPDPYAWVAANPNASPLARQMILSQTPGEVAAAKKTAAETAIANLNLRGYGSLGAPGAPAAPLGVTPVTKGAVPAVAPSAAPAARLPGPPPGTLGTGRLAVQEGPAAADELPAPPALAGGPGDGTAIRAYLDRLPAGQKAAGLARLRKMYATSPAPTQTAGGAVAP